MNRQQKRYIRQQGTIKYYLSKINLSYLTYYLLNKELRVINRKLIELRDKTERRSWNR